MTEHVRVRIQTCLSKWRSRVGGTLFVFVFLISLCALVLAPDITSLPLPMERFEACLVIAALMCLATIIAPVTLLPLVPVIAPVLGPFLTGLACWFGWTLGSVISFLIARYGGVPLLSHFVDLKTLAGFESRVPQESHFLVILALRLVIPVDILSYALGFFSAVSLPTYTLASALGILWFSFFFSYFGLLLVSYPVLFIAYGVVSAIIVGCALWYVRRAMRAK